MKSKKITISEDHVSDNETLRNVGSSNKISATKKKKKNDSKKKLVIPKNVRESIPYKYIYENGIIEMNDGTFIRAYGLDEVNFKTAPDEDQKSIYLAYESVLNSISSTIKMQVCIVNRTADKSNLLNDIKLIPRKDGFDPLRNEYNAIIEQKMNEGRNSLEQKKYIILTTEAEDIEAAVRIFGRADTELSNALKKVTQKETEPLKPSEYIYLLHNIYNMGTNARIENMRTEDGNFYLDFDVLTTQGLSTKDIVAPDSMEFKPGYFCFGNKFGRSLYLKQYPAFLSTDFFDSLLDLPYNMLVSVHYTPIDPAKATKLIQNQLTFIAADLAKRQAKAATSGISAELISPALVKSRDKTQQLLADITGRNQKLFIVTLVVTCIADTAKELDDAISTIKSVAEAQVVTFGELKGLQEVALRAAMPFGMNELRVDRMLTTECATVFIPYTAQELNQKGGALYGINSATRNLIVYNRLTANNANGIIIGGPGSGKSFAAKLEMIYALLSDPYSLVYVIDPDGEYSELTRSELTGQEIVLSQSTRNYLNPLDMDLNYAVDEKGRQADPVALKADYVRALIQTMQGGAPLNPAQKTIIDRCVRLLYQPYVALLNQEQYKSKGITNIKSASPTLVDLYDTLMSQREDEAKNIAIMLEIYAKGGLNLFAHRTNVNLQNRLVTYNILDLPQGLKELGLQVCIDNIWNQTLANFRRGYTTWFYVDEFSSIANSETTCAYLAQIWRRARKWGGIPTAITQQAEDFFLTPEAKVIFKTSEFKLMFKQDQTNRVLLGEQLRIPDSQLGHIADSGYGIGLLNTGKSTVAFYNNFPTNTKIYDIISTKASEKLLKNRQATTEDNN